MNTSRSIGERTAFQAWLVLLLSVGLPGALWAQVVEPMEPPPNAVWGGYALPAGVPYQPTLPNECDPAAPVVIDPAWQTNSPPTDAPNQAVMLDNLAPGVAPIAVPTDNGDIGSAEPSLKQSLIPPGARNGFFQKAKFTATWIPQPDSFSLGWTDLRSEVVTALPFFTRENPIIITPSYEAHFLDRPATLFLPPRLHDVAIDFHVFRVFGNHWIADLAVQPGLYSDDDSFDSEEALRINGRAVGVYAPTIDVKWALGVTYLDGGWSKVVPVAGVIYTPTDDVEYQLIFPTPRVSWRLTNISAAPGSDERWVYVGLQYGNAAWAFQQPDGTPDVFASRDYRVVLGLERRIIRGISHTFEIGYVFNRDIKVASVSGEDIDQSDALLLRVGVWY